MTDRRRLTRLVDAAAALADDADLPHAAYVLGSLLLALAEGSEPDLARRLRAAEDRACGLRAVDVFPGANRG